MDFKDQLGRLLAKLQEVNIEGSQLQSKRDESLLKVESELAAASRELIETKLELENERRGREKDRRQRVEAQELLAATLRKLSKANDDLSKANEALTESTRENVAIKQQLEFAKKEMAEKDEQIREMEEYILNEDDNPETSVALDVSTDSGNRSVEEKFRSFSLSPIPEENPDEIPYYYDECKRYAEKLQIVIGSDSKSSVLSISDTDGDKTERCPKLCLPSEPKSVISTESEKENSQQKAKKKRKQQFKVLFGLAHY